MVTNKPTVETRSPAMQAVEAKRELCRDLMAGTDGMIAAGKRWLPQHPGESAANYKIRLQSNILTNFLALAISKQTGKIFSKPIRLQENVPEALAVMCKDFDLQGRNLSSFVMDVANTAFRDGISYIMVDFPRVEGVQTLEQEKAAGARPYAVHIKPDQLLEVVAERINGVETVTRIRIKECNQIPAAEGWGYVETEQVRVLRRDPADGSIWFEIWQEIETAGDRDKWVKVEEGKTTFRQINLVPVYANRTGFMMGEPPNQATAELNLKHWRSTSEQINALSFQRFAMLSAVGVSDDSVIAIGPSKLLKSTNPEAKFTFVEPTGKGVEAGRLDLEGIEKQIETASATLRVERGGTVTATAAAIDSAETNAGLKAVASGIKDSVEQVLRYFAELSGLESGGEVEVNQEFGDSKGTPQGLQSLDKARALGDLSRRAYLEALKWRGELDEDFDLDANDEEISSEGPDLSGEGSNA